MIVSVIHINRFGASRFRQKETWHAITPHCGACLDILQRHITAFRSCFALQCLEYCPSPRPPLGIASGSPEQIERFYRLSAITCQHGRRTHDQYTTHLRPKQVTGLSYLVISPIRVPLLIFLGPGNGFCGRRHPRRRTASPTSLPSVHRIYPLFTSPNFLPLTDLRIPLPLTGRGQHKNFVRTQTTRLIRVGQPARVCEPFRCPKVELLKVV